ncbi:unnamed protein product [Closterium sp. Naga37s-1]|nr:unnamed protein product [Closterium sp. Naga37s-1]
MTQRVVTEHEQEVLSLIDRRLDMITSFDHLTTTALTSPSEPGAGDHVVHGVRRIRSNWDNFILQPPQGDLVSLGRTSPGPGMLPSFMVELFWKRMEEEIEEDTSRQAQHGVSGPGSNANEQEGSSSESSSSDESVEHDDEGAREHPGGTERTEEHGVALGERVDERVKHIEQQATGDDGAVEEQEGGAAVQDFGTGVQ